MATKNLLNVIWTEELKKELISNAENHNVGQTLLLENDSVKVWHILLQPGERLPFHKHTLNYFWTALRDGEAISNYSDGSTKKMLYQRNDIAYYNIEEGGSFIHDLKNTGSTPLEFITTELK